MTLMSAHYEQPTRAISTRGCAIVIPCFDEGARLDVNAYEKFLADCDEAHLIFVDDGSRDNTLDLVMKIKARFPTKVSVLTLAENAGKAEAVRQGLLYASQRNYPYIGYWDADLATPLDVIEDFLKVARKIRSLQVVFGSRRSLLGHRINRAPGRKFVSFACASLARHAVGIPVGDTQCGAKLLRNTNVVKNALQTPFTSGWLFDVELLGRIAWNTEEAAHAFYEMPLREWYEVGGSKITCRDFAKCAVGMVKLIVQMRFGLFATGGQTSVQATAREVGIKSKPVNKLTA